MRLKILFLLSFSISLFADVYLKNSYYVKEKEIMLSDIVKNIENDVKLFDIDKNRYSKRVKSKKILQILQSHGLKDYKSKHAYIQFTKKSPIKTQKIKNAIEKVYKEKYTHIKIKTVSVEPRSYIGTLPQSYETVLKSKSHLSKDGILYIKTDDKKKIFFNYKIDAEVVVYEARNDIKRNIELSNLNSKKKSIILNKFRAMPLQNILKGTLQSTHNIKRGTILTTRDAQGLYLVKRGSNVNVTLSSSNLAISFSAEALQNGRFADIITVIKSNGKKVKVRVTGKRRAEVR
ncbi:MAG: flagellar basal body P-ring formation chaperone FlgA [Campylobacterota bacterium]